MGRRLRMTEFRRGDVLAEIYNTKICWIVKEVIADGYYVDAWFDGSYHKSGTWISFKSARRDLVKVDEWDDWKMVMQNVEDI